MMNYHKIIIIYIDYYYILYILFLFVTFVTLSPLSLLKPKFSQEEVLKKNFGLDSDKSDKVTPILKKIDTKHFKKAKHNGVQVKRVLIQNITPYVR